MILDGSVSRDLLILIDPDANPADDMIENILEDTLMDLNQMSPKEGTSKVNPLRVVPYTRFTDVERLVIKDRFRDFVECPKLNANELGRLTKSSRGIQGAWQVHQFFY